MAFDFYFAGSQCQETTDLIRDLNANVLKSYVNDMRTIKKWFEYKKQGWKGNLIIDNGAFTVHKKGGEINIDEYIQWLNENDEFIDYAIALDHIPGIRGKEKTQEEVAYAPVKTWENYMYMVEKCKSPQKLLPVFHQPENFKYLQQILDFRIDGEPVRYMCISGNKELTKKQREDWYCEVYDFIKKSSNPNIKTHILGSATISDAENFPCTSMDASSWIMTGANGSIFTDRGNILISSANTKSPENIIHADKTTIEYVEQYCRDCGYELKDAQDDYKIRMLINIKYLYRRSTQCKYVGRNFVKKRLF